MLSFTKYQGLGNDFLIVDLRDTTLAVSPEYFVDGVFPVARALCDRRYGVGGDGVLTLTAPTSDNATATMRVLNSDGSEAEMCGNGLRCVAKHLLDKQDKQDKQGCEVIIDTLAGPLHCHGHRGDGNTGKIKSVTAQMGAPRLTRREIPMRGEAAQRCINQPTTLGDAIIKITALSMGNPHAVVFVPETGTKLRTIAKTLGPQVEVHTSFPNRTNAEFAHIRDSRHIELWVWERGCGITQACGTGACATAVAACLLGHAETETAIDVKLPGGTLAITVAHDYEAVHMRGPAERVYSGSISKSWLARRLR